MYFNNRISLLIYDQNYPLLLILFEFIAARK